MTAGLPRSRQARPLALLPVATLLPQCALRVPGLFHDGSVRGRL